MIVKRSGPPRTHDRVTWRVPLSAPPSLTWQQAFQAAEESTEVARARAVQFEEVALTFRSDDDHVPVWIEYIDKWIAHANSAQADVDTQRRLDAAQVQQQRDTRRQQAQDANERFKDL